MERLAEILALLADADAVAALTADELAALDAELVALAETLAAGDLNDDTLAALQQINTATQQVRATAEAQTVEAQRLADEAAAALAAIRGEQTDPAPEGDPAPAPADDPPAPEGDPAADPEDPAAPVSGVDAPLPIAAAAGATPQPIRPRLSSVRSRAPQPSGLPSRTSPADLPSPDTWGLVASANMADQGLAAGEALDDMGKISRAFLSAWESTKGYRHGPRIKVPVARAGADNAADLYGEDRFLGRDPIGNERKIKAVTSMQALTAAGGICAPINVSYDMPVLGDDDRPFRDDALARFGADRGGVSTLPIPVLTDLDDAVGIWTEANDQNPSNPATKPCLVITCDDDENETLVEAITLCLQTGNFRARYFPEQVEAWMRLAAVNHARRAETRLMTTVGSGSTQVTSGQLLGATRDVLTTLDRAVASQRSRHRISSAFPLRFVAPFWLRDMIRTDLAREMPGSAQERLAVADAEIEAFIRSRRVNVTWALDGESGQVFGAQGDGPLIGWPSTVVTYLYPEGSWLFLDGGELNLGIVRDTTTNAVNDFQMFSETFEGAHFHGVESYRLTMDLCPDGTSSGTADIDPCGVGS